MNTKKLSRIIPVIILLALLIVSSVFVLASCGGNETDDPTSGVTDIFFAKSSSPRKTYVLGQDLDLTVGTLTVVIDGEYVPITLTTEGVTVTGYNSEVSGSQEITVSYEGLSTTYTVNVIPRISPESYETNYFMGDDFNNGKGRLRVARDDGSTYLVDMNDEGVSLKSFNSAVAGKSNITIEYTVDGNAYEASFEVTVHVPESVVFHLPTKLEYRNHVETLDLTGGYFEVKAAAPSTFSKNVPLTQSMVSGYRPGDVTIANRTVPVEQTILVNYAGFSDTFKVSVLYSGIKIVREQAARLLAFNVDFDDALTEGFKLPNGADIIALDAIKEYYALSNNDRDLIDEELVDVMIKTATVCLNSSYKNEQEKLADAFLMEPSQGAFMIVGTTIHDVRDAIAVLEDPESNFNVVTNLLRFLKDEFGSHDFNNSYTVTRLISVHAPEMMTSESKGILTALKQINKVYSFMENFPATWDTNTLKDNESAILDVTSAIRLSTMKGPAYEFVYGVIRNWREDFFDIIYAYYFDVATNGINDISTKVWNTVPAPSVMNVWYTSYLSAYNFLYSQEVDNNGNYVGLIHNTNNANGMCKDLFEFYFHYNRTLTVGDEIKALGKDNVNYKMYNLLGGDEWIDYYLRCSQIGYIVLMGTGLGDEKVEKAWDAYLVLLELLYNNGGDIRNILSCSAEFQAFTNALSDMTPVQLNKFLSSVCFRYSEAQASGAMFDILEFLSSGSTKNYIAYFLANFFSAKLSQNGMIVLQQILVSMEQASLIHIKEAATNNFNSTADNLLNNYYALKVADRDVLNTYFGDAISKYTTIYTQLTGTNPSTPNADQQEKLDEINDLLDYFDSLLQELNELAQEDTKSMSEEDLAKHLQRQNDAFATFITTFDKIDSLYNGILNANDNMLEVFLSTYKYSIVLEDKEGNPTTIYYTIDTRMTSARSYFISYMVGTGINNTMAWDIYTQFDMAGVLAEIFPLIKSEYEMTVVENALAYRDIVNSLSDEQIVGIYMLCGRLYSASFQRYYNSLLSDANKALEATEKLLTAENYYWVYKNSPSDEVLTEFNKFFNEVKDIYEAMEDGEQKTNFENVLGDFYNLCLEYYNELNPTPDPAPEA